MENDPTTDRPQHAILSPSGSERWISCPASIRVEQSIPSRPESPYANEGTAAHALAEILLHCEILGTNPPDYCAATIDEWMERYQVTTDQYVEMLEHVNGYVAFVQERLLAFPHSQLLVEQRVDTGVPSCWGTSDAIIVSPTHIETIDLKYGMGVRVDAEDNSQLKLYGVGALETFGELLGDPEYVYITIYQPRLDHVSTWSILADELRSWRDSIIPIAELALGEDAPFGPSEAACRWCDARGLCKAQRDFSLRQDFGPVDLLDEDELGEMLDRIPAIEAWCAAVRDQGLELAYSQRKKVKGYKVVRSNGRRFVKDQVAAIKALRAKGYRKQDIVKESILGIGELEKLLGDKFTPLIGEYVAKSEGKPSLVKDTDKRPEIDPASDAAQDFREGDES